MSRGSRVGGGFPHPAQHAGGDEAGPGCAPRSHTHRRPQQETPRVCREARWRQVAGQLGQKPLGARAAGVRASITRGLSRDQGGTTCCTVWRPDWPGLLEAPPQAPPWSSPELGRLGFPGVRSIHHPGLHPNLGVFVFVFYKFIFF